jgi:APA family basic amino acid/polyamine antiporter
MTAPRSGLAREMGLMGLVATGICSMIGAAINVIPFMIQRSVPGIGPHVMLAYAFAALPAVLAGLAYAILASAMPRAGGSYIYASRALSPYLGFVASFSQWFGLSIAIGVVSYILPTFLRDIATAAGQEWLAVSLNAGRIRLMLALAFLWTFVLVNLRGVKSYERTVIPLMWLMFALGGVVIVAGFMFNHADFAAAVLRREGRTLALPDAPPLAIGTFVPAAVLLFASFIGFDSIAQAGGEARNPGRSLPLAIGISVLAVGTFYLLFTAAVYHAVPWQYVAEQAAQRDVTAPGLLGYLLPRGWTVLIVAGAAVSLTNDLPAMLLAVSRLMFAWAEDGIFPKVVAKVHAKHHTPHVAILLSAAMATVGIIGSHLAGDFFLGVDILVTSMLVNFLLMCLSVLALPSRNPLIARDVTVLPSRALQVPLATFGALLLGGLLVAQTWKDLTMATSAWYFRTTPVWLIVMAIASVIYLREVRALARSGVDLRARFATLPPE